MSDTPIQVEDYNGNPIELSDKATGVYCLRNTQNGKRYVGSGSVSIMGRFKSHRSYLQNGKHWNRHLQSAWKAYGESAFVYVVLEYCPPQDCIEREQHWIDRFRSADSEHGYNLSVVADSPLGLKRTPEARAKMSAAHTGKKRGPFSDEHKARLSAAKKGKPFTDEHRAALSAAKTGKPGAERTTEWVEKQRASILKACPNKSGLPGVYESPTKGKWCAKIVVNGKRKHLGTFATPEEASAAYMAEFSKQQAPQQQDIQ